MGRSLLSYLLPPPRRMTPTATLQEPCPLPPLAMVGFFVITRHG